VAPSPSPFGRRMKASQIREHLPGHPRKIPETDWRYVMKAVQLRKRSWQKVLVDVDDKGHRRTRLKPLDGSARAHNPKVGGSNPPPATIGTLVVASRAWGAGA
jgi:hypothetical protein